MPQNHLKTLEKCECGALRYLALRDKGKRYELMLLHIELLPNKKRKTIQKTLFSYRKPYGGFSCLGVKKWLTSRQLQNTTS